MDIDTQRLLRISKQLSHTGVALPFIMCPNLFLELKMGGN
jgi:hypothetical protein